jgi:hypothetical protein
MAACEPVDGIATDRPIRQQGEHDDDRQRRVGRRTISDGSSGPPTTAAKRALVPGLAAGMGGGLNGRADRGQSWG